MWNVGWEDLGFFLSLSITKQAQGWPGVRGPFSYPHSFLLTQGAAGLSAMWLGTWFGSCRVGPPVLGSEPVKPSCVWTLPPLGEGGGLNRLLFFF